MNDKFKTTKIMVPVENYFAALFVRHLCGVKMNILLPPFQ